MLPIRGHLIAIIFHIGSALTFAFDGVAIPERPVQPQPNRPNSVDMQPTTQSQSKGSDSPQGEKESFQTSSPQSISRWNAQKDADSLSYRLNDYSGRHGQGRSGGGVPQAAPLSINPYVQYDVVDDKGNTWEKISGSADKLQEFIANNPDSTFIDSEGNLYGPGLDEAPTSFEKAKNVLVNAPLNLNLNSKPTWNINLSNTTTNNFNNTQTANNFFSQLNVTNNIGEIKKDLELSKSTPTPTPDAEKTQKLEALSIAINNTISIGNDGEENAAPAAQGPKTILALRKLASQKDGNNAPQAAVEKSRAQNSSALLPVKASFGTFETLNLPTSTNWLSWLLWVIAISASLTGGWYLFWLIKKKKKQNVEPPSPKPAHKKKKASIEHATSATRMARR